MKTITRVLIANRGEIAARIGVTIRRMGLLPIFVFSEADRETKAIVEVVKGASGEVHLLGPAAAGESYLNVDRILALAKVSKADAIHPGYGFLSEDSSFARRVIEAGLVWIGPSPEAMDRVSSKSRAKELAESVGVPTLPGLRGTMDISAFTAAATKIDYPVLLKAVAGGGGRGIRKVTSNEELAVQFPLARAEAERSFANGELLLEKYVERAHHVEVQIFGDEHGNLIHLGDRDCSTQRRHQKIIEESPSPAISPAVRARLLDSAVKIAKAAGYSNAGTVEFLVEGDSFYFLEVNTRLQVEHPVTEALTGLDLVELQIRIARGESLGRSQDQIRFQGHAIELRLCAEDAAKNFRPSTGRISKIHFPDDVRVDDSLVEGLEITPFYDSMLAKIIVRGADRPGAIRKAVEALDDTFIGGITTNRSYLRNVLTSPDFANATLTTRDLDEKNFIGTLEANVQLEAIAAAALVLSRTKPENVPVPLDSWSNAGPRSTFVVLKNESGDSARWRVERGQAVMTVTKQGTPFTIPITLPLEGHVHVDDGLVHVQIGASEVRFLDALYGSREGANVSSPDVVTAPMDGVLSKLTLAIGAKVRKGETLAVLEAMKMQIELKAPRDGRIESVFASAGSQVKNRQPIVKLELPKQG